MSKKLKIFIAAAAPAAAMLLFIFRKLILKLSYFSPKCWFKTVTGYYCPGCGNTRSVRALLKGNVIESIHNNITPLLLLTLLVMLYAELVLSVFGKDVRLLPRKFPFWMAVIGTMMAYYVVRNFFAPIAPL